MKNAGWVALVAALVGFPLVGGEYYINLASQIFIAAIYTFGSALLPDLAYVILFLPMIFVIAFRPRGLFGRHGA